MPIRSHNPNVRARPKVRTLHPDFSGQKWHGPDMPRRGVPEGRPDWYLVEWMAERGLTQAEMMRRAEWSKATMSQLYNHLQDYNPRVVRTAARVFGIEIYELFLPPKEAQAIQQLRAAAKAIAASNL